MNEYLFGGSFLLSLIVAIRSYIKLKKESQIHEKEQKEQEKIQECLLFLLKKQEQVLELQRENSVPEEILILNHCAENIGVQLSANKFNYQILPYGIANEYLLKSKLDHTK